MLRVVALFAILCACLLLFGGERADRLSISTINERTQITVIITLFDVTDEYRWLSVYGCSAEQAESGVYCTGDFERESTQEITGRKQYLFAWRSMPRGMIQITAVAFDVGRKPLARNSLVMFR